MQNSRNKNTNEISDLMKRYMPYWPYFLLSFIICMGLAVAYLFWATPVYDISASILIKDDSQNNNNTNNNQFMSSLDVFSSTKAVDNEIQILQSRELMDEVVKKLDLYAPIYQAGFLHGIPAYTLSPVNIEAQSPDLLYPTRKKVFFTYEDSAGNKVVSVENKNFPLNTWINSSWGEIRFVPNPDFTPSSDNLKRRFYFFIIRVDDVADGLLKLLNVEQATRLSSTINLNLKDPVPIRGEDILNTLINFYNEENLEDKNKLAANALTFLDERLHYVSYGLDSIETALQSFKSNSGAVNLSEQGRLILGGLQTNDEKISEMNVQLTMLRQIQQFIQQGGDGIPPGLIPFTNGINNNQNGTSDPVLSSYLENLYNAELQYDQLRKTTAQNSPMLISLSEEIAKIKPTILQYVNNQISALEAAVADLNNNSDQYSSQLRTIPKKERELLEMTRQQSIKSDLYTFLLQKREEAALSYAASVTDSRVVDPPQAGILPVSPKRMMILGIACILGLGIPVAFLSFNKKIISKEEITAILDFPIIGEISSGRFRKKIIADKYKKGLIGEEFRHIRTSLLSLKSSKNQKKFLVTSSIPGEGKSFVASNIAYNLALTGKKVILLELDLRKPSLGKLFDLSGKKGIAEFLSSDTEVWDIIYPTNFHPNFYFIPAGDDIPDNPSELLLNGKLPELLSSLQENFDYVIVETTPVSLFTDGYIVSEMCDITIFIVRYNVTPHRELLALKEDLSVKKLKNPLIIFNGIKYLGKNSYRSKYYQHYLKKTISKESISV
jgi:tyrosine-protein kinase Etk/Wzc